MATIYDVAQKAGVSIGTVSRYLSGNGYVGLKTRERIKSAILELDFSPSGVARGLSNKRTHMIGFVVPDLQNPFIPEVVRGAQDLADQAEYCVLIYNTDSIGQREVRALQILYERRVDGLIIMPPETPEGNNFIRHLHKLQVPMVLIGRNLQDVVIDRVTTTTYTGAVEAVLYLAQLGHKNIAFIGGEYSQGVALGRRRGYLEGLRRSGLTVNEQYMVETSLSREGGSAAMAQLLERSLPFTAVFAVNDIVAIGAMQEFIRRGGRIPDNLSIVGFDDIALSAHMHPALTTVAQPKALLGQTAVDLLLKRIESENTLEPREIRLECTLIKRDSTAPPL